MSEPLPGSVTTAPNGQTYIYFGGVWGPAEGVTGGIQVDYNSLTVKPETSFNSAVTKIKNEESYNKEEKKEIHRLMFCDKDDEHAYNSEEEYDFEQDIMESNDWSMDDTIYEITDGCELEIMS